METKDKNNTKQQKEQQNTDQAKVDSEAKGKNTKDKKEDIRRSKSTARFLGRNQRKHQRRCKSCGRNHE